MVDLSKIKPGAKTRKAKLDPNRFEPFVDFDTDGAVFQVGLQHFAYGPAGPAIRINTGGLEIQYRAHHTDIDTLIDGLKKARKRLREMAEEKAAQ